MIRISSNSAKMAKKANSIPRSGILNAMNMKLNGKSQLFWGETGKSQRHLMVILTQVGYDKDFK